MSKRLNTYCGYIVIALLLSATATLSGCNYKLFVKKSEIKAPSDRFDILSTDTPEQIAQKTEAALSQKKISDITQAAKAQENINNSDIDFLRLIRYFGGALLVIGILMLVLTSSRITGALLAASGAMVIVMGKVIIQYHTYGAIVCSAIIFGLVGHYLYKCYIDGKKEIALNQTIKGLQDGKDAIVSAAKAAGDINISAALLNAKTTISDSLSSAQDSGVKNIISKIKSKF